MQPKPDSLLDGLIASKLYPPVLDVRAISRHEFVSRTLAQGHGQTIALVAPAGSGKSSLMADLHRGLMDQGVGTCWLGLDKEDNDPATFARYVISAIQVIAPEFAYEELVALSANPVRDFDAFFNRLVSHLSKLTYRFAICLDDFQNISDTHLIGFLNGLIEHLPPTMTLIIASRHQLPLKLVKQSLAGRAVEIKQEELNFDRDQTDLFLRRYHDLNLSTEDVQQLVDITEGWPTGVQLAALALRRYPGQASELLRSFSGRDLDLTRYLAESVIQSQPKNVRHFLLRTSVLRRMTPKLCEAIGAAEDAEAMLDEIRRANLFLITLDHEGRWSRYHHLFAEFLQNEFRKSDPDAYRQTCLAASRWYEKNGEADQAIRYALEAEHYDQAADLISVHALRTSAFRGDHYTVRDWMRRLPEAYHAKRPDLLLAHAWSCAFSRDTARAMDMAESVLHGLKNNTWKLSKPERERWLLWTGVVQAATCACADTIDECIRRSDALLPRVPDNEPFLIATLGNCLSYSHFAKLNFEDSRRFAVSAHQHGHLADAAYLSAWGDFLHGLIDVEQGHLQAAERLSERVRRDSANLGLGQKSYVAGLAALLEAEIAVQRGDMESAARSIDVGRAFKEIFGPVEPQLVALRNEARLLVRRGEIGLAQTVLEAGQDAALREQHQRLFWMLAMEQVSLMLTAGELDWAEKAAARTRIFDDAESDIGWLRSRRTALRLLDARMKLHAGNHKSALRILTSLQQSRGAPKKGPQYLSITTYRALALWAAGNHSDAMRQLDRAISGATDEHHLFPILSAGNLLQPLLEHMEERRKGLSMQDLQPRLTIQKALKQGLRSEYSSPAPEKPSPTKRRMKSVGKKAEIPSEASETELTRRELDLLRLAQAGLSNKDVADAMLVSISTVKWHFHNVYEKLGVGSRGAAVAVAVKTGKLAALHASETPTSKRKS